MLLCYYGKAYDTLCVHLFRLTWVGHVLYMNLKKKKEMINRLPELDGFFFFNC